MILIDSWHETEHIMAWIWYHYSVLFYCFLNSKDWNQKRKL